MSVRATLTFCCLLLVASLTGTLASPALVDGRWYFRTEGELICIGS